MSSETTETLERTAAAIGAPERYDGLSILLHWITAALVVLPWCLGQTIDWFPKGAPKIDARSTHFLLGATLGIMNQHSKALR